MTKVFQNGTLVRANLAAGTDEDGNVDLSKMTKDELLAEAAHLGVEVDPTATKAVIIAALIAAVSAA